MAEETGQERTEQPTEKRLQDARLKGQVPRSKELNTFVVMLSGAALLVLLTQQMMGKNIELLRGQFILTREQIFDPNTIVEQLTQSMWSGLLSIGPILAITVLGALLSSIAISGWIFSSQALAPKWERLNPIKGLAKLFAVRGLIELIKAVLKIGLILTVAITLFTAYIDQFIGLNRESLLPAVGHAADLIGNSFLVLCGSLVVIAAIDVPFQLWDHKRQLKMTRQQVKDEVKERDGNPQVKSRIRSVQMEMAQQRMMEKVPTADVVVTNPTHYAVALSYDLEKTDAPRVVAKGKDIIAAQIRTLANGAKVPLVSAPPLARALYHSVKVDAEIPEGLYLAVAQVLAYVYQLNESEVSGSDHPLPPEELPVPDSFKQPTDHHE